MVGMLMMLNACDNTGLASTSTFTTWMVPSYFSASFSISGATIRHGPHHAAQKSTTTGLSLPRTSSWKLASVATLISDMFVFSPLWLAGNVPDESISLDNPWVGEAVVDGCAVAPR